MFKRIMNWLGYVRCEMCNKWTHPSYIEGNICSFKCMIKRRKGDKE